MIPESLKKLGHWDDKTWNHIEELSNAIESVPNNYVYNCDNGGDGRFHVERVFAYELYYRWKRLLFPNEDIPQDLLLNAELTKHYHTLEHYGFPDLLLHGGYNVNDKQFIICEIKSSRTDPDEQALEKDMKSLRDGINVLSFKCGVFIYLGVDTTYMISRLRNILQEIDFNDRKKIIFVGVDGRNSAQYDIL